MKTKPVLLKVVAFTTLLSFSFTSTIAYSDVPTAVAYFHKSAAYLKGRSILNQNPAAIRSELRAKSEVVRLESIDPAKLAQELSGMIEAAAQSQESSQNGDSFKLEGESRDPQNIQAWLDLGFRSPPDMKEISTAIIREIEKFENHAKITVDRTTHPQTIQIRLTKEIDFFGKKSKSILLFLDAHKDHLPFHLIPKEGDLLPNEKSNLDSLRTAIQNGTLHAADLVYGLPTVQSRDHLLTELFGHTDYQNVLHDDETMAARRAEALAKIRQVKNDWRNGELQLDSERRRAERPGEIKRLILELPNEEPFISRGPWEKPFVLLPENGKPGRAALETRRGQVVQFEFTLDDSDNHIISLAKQALNNLLERERQLKHAKRLILKKRIVWASVFGSVLSIFAALFYYLPVVRWFQRDLQYRLFEDPAPQIPYDQVDLSIGFSKLDKFALLVPPGNSEKMDRLAEELRFILDQDLKYAETEEDRNLIREFISLISKGPRLAIGNEVTLNGRSLLKPFEIVLMKAPQSKDEPNSALAAIDYDYTAWLPRKFRLMNIRYFVNVAKFIHYPEKTNNPRAVQFKKYRQIHRNNISLVIQPDGSYQYDQDLNRKMIPKGESLYESAQRDPAMKRLLDYYQDPKMKDWFRRYVVYATQPHYEQFVVLAEAVLKEIGPPGNFDDYIQSFSDEERREAVANELKNLRHLIRPDGSLDKRKIRLAALFQLWLDEINGNREIENTLSFTFLLSGRPDTDFSIFTEDFGFKTPEAENAFSWLFDYTDPLIEVFDNEHAESFKPTDKVRSELRQKPIEAVGNFSTSVQSGAETRQLIQDLFALLAGEEDEPLHADKEDFTIVMDLSAYGTGFGKIKIDYKRLGISTGIFTVRYQQNGHVRTVEVSSRQFAQTVQSLLGVLQGSEVEVDLTWMRGNGIVAPQKWDGWGSGSHEFGDQFLVYREEIHPAAVKAAEHAVRSLSQKTNSRPFVIADLFGGNGAFLKSLDRALSLQWPNRQFRYHLIENSAANIESYLINSSISKTTVYQQDISQLSGPLELLLGEKPDLVTIIGGLNRGVITAEAAHEVAKKVYESLSDGGFLVVTGFTEALLNSENFSEIGFKVLNKSVPGNILSERYPKHLYVLQKSELRSQNQNNSGWSELEVDLARMGQRLFEMEELLTQRLAGEKDRVLERLGTEDAKKAINDLFGYVKGQVDLEHGAFPPLFYLVHNPRFDRLLAEAISVAGTYHYISVADGFRNELEKIQTELTKAIEELNTYFQTDIFNELVGLVMRFKYAAQQGQQLDPTDKLAAAAAKFLLARMRQYQGRFIRLAIRQLRLGYLLNEMIIDPAFAHADISFIQIKRIKNTVKIIYRDGDGQNEIIQSQLLDLGREDSFNFLTLLKLLTQQIDIDRGNVSQNGSFILADPKNQNKKLIFKVEALANDPDQLAIEVLDYKKTNNSQEGPAGRRGELRSSPTAPSTISASSQDVMMSELRSLSQFLIEMGRRSDELKKFLEEDFRKGLDPIEIINPDNPKDKDKDGLTLDLEGQFLRAVRKMRYLAASGLAYDEVRSLLEDAKNLFQDFKSQSPLFKQLGHLLTLLVISEVEADELLNPKQFHGLLERFDELDMKRLTRNRQMTVRERLELKGAQFTLWIVNRDQDKFLSSVALNDETPLPYSKLIQSYVLEPIRKLRHAKSVRLIRNGATVTVIVSDNPGKMISTKNFTAKPTGNALHFFTLVKLIAKDVAIERQHTGSDYGTFVLNRASESIQFKVKVIPTINPAQEEVLITVENRSELRGHESGSLNDVFPELSDPLFKKLLSFADNEQVFLDNAAALAQKSAQGSALLFGILGPHLRHDHRIGADELDIQVMPILIKGFLPSLKEFLKDPDQNRQKILEYGSALINGLLFVPNKTAASHGEEFFKQNDYPVAEFGFEAYREILKDISDSLEKDPSQDFLAVARQVALLFPEVFPERDIPIFLRHQGEALGELDAEQLADFNKENQTNFTLWQYVAGQASEYYRRVADKEEKFTESYEHEFQKIYAYLVKGDDAKSELRFGRLTPFEGLEVYVEMMASSVREAARQIDADPGLFLTPELGNYLNQTFEISGESNRDLRLKRGVILMDTLTREAGEMTPLLVRYYKAQGYEVAVVSDGAIAMSLQRDEQIKIFKYPDQAADYLRNERGAGFIQALGLREDAGVAMAMKNRGLIDYEKSADSIEGLFSIAAFAGNLNTQFRNAHELIIKA